MVLIHLKDVEKHYSKTTHIRFPEVKILQGGCLFLRGSNGVGKSTLLKIILKHISPTRASVYYLAQVKISYVPEVFVLPYGIKLKTFLKCMCVLFASNYPSHLLAYFELNDNFYTHQLSKGMRQKVGLIIAFIKKCTFIILDEPYSGLDERMQDKLDFLIEDHLKKGITFLIASHHATVKHAFAYKEIVL